MTTTLGVTDEQLVQYGRDGFFRIEGFADAAVCDAMLERVVEIARRGAAGEDVRPALILPEANLAGRPGNPEDLVSKIFKLHRDPVFNEFARSTAVTDVVAAVLRAEEVDCFLSQFIFKAPGAWGQPWHQDSYFFPFEPMRPVVGIWLAVTEATLENGCLHVLRSSHEQPIHEHVPDRRPGANYGYVEIVDHDMSASEPVRMHPGDLLVFDSHLMHRSTDNVSDGIRAAMVYHYAVAGTKDLTLERQTYSINDWMPARRRP
jgi:ectoine hydroxylase-related dioxygenase (phytanoyl-CoA dioxygenase family)